MTVTAPTPARWSKRCSGPAPACSRPSTKSALRWRKRPAASNCRGCRRRRSQAISISPASPRRERQARRRLRPMRRRPLAVQEARLSPADDPLAPRSHHRLRPAGGDALRYRPSRRACRASKPDKIDIAAAAAACNDAIARYPDVARFVFEAGRVATARKDYAEARRLYEQAAAAGYAMAMNNIGGVYEGGDGVPLNYVEAARWYGKAVAAGEPIAMVDLGWLYETGHGVTKDYAEARRLYEAAAKAGVPAGMNNLGLLYMYGKGVARDYAEARRLFEQGAALGDAAAMNGLGGDLQRRRRRSPQCHHRPPMVREGGGAGQSGGEAEPEGDAPVMRADLEQDDLIPLLKPFRQVARNSSEPMEHPHARLHPAGRPPDRPRRPCPRRATMSPPRKASSARRSRRSAATMRRRPIPMRRPRSRSMFPQADIFMAMVQQQLRPGLSPQEFRIRRGAGRRTARSRSASTSSTPTAKPGKRCTRWSSSPTAA